MGMGASTLPLLMKLKQRGHIANGSAVIEIGAQQLDDSFIKARRDIAAAGRLFGASTPPPSFAWTGARSDTNVLAGAPLARAFWTWLGLDYASIDIDGSPGSIPLDLNYDEIPPQLAGRYALVTNFGTTEHVANQLQSFKIIHDLAAAGALMLHVLPAGGMLNHGLVAYNPKFFWLLGRSNGYKIVFMTMGWSERDPGLPKDLQDFLTLYDREAASQFADFRLPESSVVVVLQKIFDTPFVAPIDVPTGTTTEHASLRERYWSVLKPDFSFQARESDLLARIRNVYDREQSLAAKEVDLERRKRDVYEREQHVAAHEWTRYIIFAPIRLSYRLRRWLYAHAPPWLVAAKRRMFGAASAKSDGTRSRGT
ncbi:MAG TPA: hypothetical protein VK749_04355 [Xanthobacteraceae bacterium]|nr:hypothetical protein [Xanthobacteraceae bacterium]